jgi:hypothetical protein
MAYCGVYSPLEYLQDKIINGTMEEIKEILLQHPNLLANGNLLQDAVSTGRLKLVKYLVKRGCVVSGPHIHKHLFTSAIRLQYGSSEMLKYFIDLGCKIGDAQHQEILVFAVESNNLEALELLVQNGYEVKSQSKTLFNSYLKVIYPFDKDFRSMRKMISLGCDPVAYGKQLMYKVIDKDDLVMLEYLIECGCDYLKLDIYKVWRNSLKCFDIVVYLVKKGCELAYVKHNTMDWIVDQNHLHILKFLIENGAKFLNLDELLETAKKALEKNRSEIFEYLTTTCVVIKDYSCKSICVAVTRYISICNCTQCLLKIVHSQTSIEPFRSMIKIGIDINPYLKILNKFESIKYIPHAYCFSLLTKKNKMIHIENLANNITLKTSAKKLLHKQQLISTNFSKSSLLKYILRPTSMTILLTFI